ncbi:MAG: acetylglutamate kinase [Melioribacteraceae bacterium]|nr:acetylglutamate kinase [Melioribacteraceae bacterium]
MKTVIVKLSGKALNNFLDNKQWISTLKYLQSQFDGVIIVHGAGNKISEWSHALNHQSKFIDGQRVTCKDTMDIVAAVQSGLFNSKIIGHLSANDIECAGLTGSDRGLFIADYISEKLGYVGNPKINGNTTWIKNMLMDKVIPVFSSVCRDSEGHLMNVNADVFTRALAIALKTDTVFFMSDITGVKLKGIDIATITEKDINEGIASGDITDGMIPKLKSSLELLNEGINKIWIGNDLFNLNFQQQTNMRGTWIVDSNQIAN